MKFGSVCSGIGAPDVAWSSLGWSPQWFSEIAPFPSKVLAHHYPQVPNHGSLLGLSTRNVCSPVDVIVGGTPCQSFSIAGLRGGLADSRGNLALEFCRLVGALRPAWFVWENVPGVLSSSGGRDFGSILGAMAELGYGLAWRILDARYCGVPQRRRRVFVVGSLAGAAAAGAVLFEPESVRRYSAPSQKAREDVAGTLGGGSGGRGWAPDTDRMMFVPEVAGALRASLRGTDDPHRGAVYVPVHARTLTTSATRLDSETETFVAPSIYDNHSGTLDRCGNSHGVLEQNWRVRRLTPVECSRLQGFPDTYLEMNYANAEEAHAAQILHNMWRQAGAPKTQEQERSGVAASLLAPEVLLSGVYGGWLSWAMAARCASGGGAISSADNRVSCLVRGLREARQDRRSPYRRESFEQLAGELGVPLSQLPLEEASARAFLRNSRMWAEAQRAWPLRYAFTTQGSRSLSSDSGRYAALGNSMAVPVMRWIGQRIEIVQSALERAA